MMDTRWRRLLDILGAEGLRTAIRVSFDRGRLVEAASAAGLRFPGRRAIKVDDDGLREALLKAFLEDGKARPHVLKALLRANEEMMATVGALPGQDLAGWVRALPPDRAGQALVALALDGREEAAAARALIPLEDASSPPVPPAGAAPPGAGPDTPAVPGTNEAAARALRERVMDLETARAAQEAALEGLRRAEESLRHDLVAARKESHHLRREMAHLETERERLREENLRLASRAAGQDAAAGGAARLEELSASLHHLARDHRKLSHDLEQLVRARPAAADTPARPYLDALAGSVDAIRRDLADVKRQIEQESQRNARATQELASEARMIRSEVAQWRKAAAVPAARRKGEPERVGIFVDVQNMYYAARQLNARLDFGVLMNAATRGRRLIRALAYVVQNRDIDQSGFLAMLQQKNYEVRRKDLKIRNDGSSKGDWDMEMALDILRLAESLDVVVLVSGDGDFSSLVTQIKTLGPKVEVFSFPGSTAKELIEASDRYVPLDEGFLLRGAQPLKTS